jgi:hypothetical protein
VALGRREKEQKERNKGREGGGVYVVYAHIMVIYIVYAYINRSYIYYMHDYSNCARLENIFPSM